MRCLSSTETRRSCFSDFDKGQSMTTEEPKGRSGSSSSEESSSNAMRRTGLHRLLLKRPSGRAAEHEEVLMSALCSSCSFCCRRAAFSACRDASQSASSVCFWPSSAACCSRVCFMTVKPIVCSSEVRCFRHGVFAGVLFSGSRDFKVPANWFRTCMSGKLSQATLRPAQPSTAIRGFEVNWMLSHRITSSGSCFGSPRIGSSLK
mmetsp:Transcript_5668/g.10126  ORF Transcript_5668/g.10126 Transcript_5668/m.10126 type:complete len:205 (+) Transcript_5668:152-766(+)